MDKNEHRLGRKTRNLRTIKLLCSCLTRKLFLRKILSIFLLLVFYGPQAFCYSEVDIVYLHQLFEDVRGHKNKGSNCKYSGKQFDLTSELINSENKQFKDARLLGKNQSELHVFVDIPKPHRPGLSLTISIKNNRCESFNVFEIMN